MLTHCFQISFKTTNRHLYISTKQALNLTIAIQRLFNIKNQLQTQLIILTLKTHLHREEDITMELVQMEMMLHISKGWGQMAIKLLMVEIMPQIMSAILIVVIITAFLMKIMEAGCLTA